MFNFEEELSKLPKKSGVYLFKDESEVVIYVGKAINLRNRVRQYFQKANRWQEKIKNILINIRSFEYIVTDNEVEALILECNLIKKHMPKYNILLKDDKSYPYIKITMYEGYPRIFITRRQDKDKAKYYGPYISVTSTEENIDFILKHWPLRRCNKKIDKNSPGGKECLNFHIGQCKAPCSGKITYKDYMKMIEEINEFLKGKYVDFVKQLEIEMLQASEDMEFEKAAALRDKINAIRHLSEKQKLELTTGVDQDLIAIARNETEVLVQIFFVRSGKLNGREHFMLSGAIESENSEIISNFIMQYYSGTPFVPKEIIIEHDIPEKEIVSEWLSKLKGQKVNITFPQKGEKLRLVEMSANNAHITLQQFGEHIKREKERTTGACSELQSALGLDEKHVLNRIEAYDISNIQGYESVASMVVFENGKPLRNDYRKFKIKSVIGPNDYASIEEVMARRFDHYIREKAELEEKGIDLSEGKFTKLPDILFIDGGKGQVSSAEKVLRKLNINIQVCGMIKDDKHRTRGLIMNEKEITMPYTSEGFRLLTRIQDEVHRFAIEYHRKLREQNYIKSILDDIEGIGIKRRKALLKHFGSVDEIQKADVLQLSKVPSMNINSATAVYDFFRKKYE